jgi:hypothetical protein
VVDRLEEKRKIKAKAFHERKVRITNGFSSCSHLILCQKAASIKLRQKAVAECPSFDHLEQLGY